VISEIMPNPKTETTQEWIEITNVGSASFDLNGLGIDRAGDSPAPSVVNSAACKPLAPGSYALFARSTDTTANGGLPAVDATFSFSMLNSNGDVQIVDPTSCMGTPSVCTTIYESVAYTNANGWPNQASPNGATPDGVSAQLKPTNLTPTDNDTYANWCLALADYGTAMNKGTPKAANACM
jgi:hypothetical protein